VIYKSTDKIECKFNACWKFCLHKYAIKPVLLRTIIFVSLLYMYDGYFNFSMLTTLHRFSFKLMTNKSAQHRKVLEKTKFFCFKLTAFNTSRRTYHSVAHFDNKTFSSLLPVLTPNYCCVKLLMYPKFLHIRTFLPIKWQSILGTYILNLPLCRKV
jgi:hypothetical protein